MDIKALIIAAGDGGRLREGGRETPKPLRRLLGLPLILRSIFSARQAGIRQFVITLGYEAEWIRAEISKAVPNDVSVEYVYNPDWQAGNGTSVLAAKPCLDQDFVLLMADHIFDPKLLSGLLKKGLGSSKVVLAVDSKLNTISDIAEATKVVMDEASAITAIGKDLKEYNAVDTGIFLCSTDLFSALKEAEERGDDSLSGGMRRLIARGEMAAFDVGPSWWQDVDTESDMRRAQKILKKSCVKETDGFVSRYFNRKISTFISVLCTRIGMTANQMTMITFLVGLAAAFLIARGEYTAIVVGAVLFKFASIIDGCDGEIARFKFQSSKFGEWFDTISDNLSYIIFFICVLVGALRQGRDYVLPIGIVALFGVIATLTVMYLYLILFSKGGSLTHFQKETASPKWVRKIQFMAKRDFFALAFMILAFFNRLDWILILAAIGSNLTWVAVLLMKQQEIKRGKELANAGIQ